VSIRKTIIVLVTLVGLALASAACSGSVSTGGSSASPAGTRTYSNAQYGFSITYGPDFKQGTTSGGSSSGSGSIFDIAFAYMSGAKQGTSYTDGVQVSVYKLAHSVKPAEVPKLKKEFAGLVGNLMGSLSGAKVSQKLSLAQINGVPGYKLGYVYTQNGTPIAAVTYFLLKGQYEYQVTGQAGKDDWATASPKIQAVVESFTVK